MNSPLKNIVAENFATDGSRICGVLELSPDSTIRVPDVVKQAFNIHCGDKLLLLADKNQGIALVKCRQF